MTMAPSSPTIENVLSLAKLINRGVTPDRSQQVKDAKARLEQAQKNIRTAQSVDRASDLADSAKDSLDIAEEKLAKAVTSYNLAIEKLSQAQSDQRTPEQLQLLQDRVETVQDQLTRATRKVGKLEETIKLSEAKLQQAQKLKKPAQELQTLELALTNEREKLSRASIRLRQVQADFTQSTEELKQAASATKTLEQMQALADRVSEAKGSVDRASKKVEVAREKFKQATQNAKAVAADTQKLELELAAAEAEYQRISQATQEEERFEAIERTLETVQSRYQTAREVQQAIDPFLNAEFWWNSACLGATALTALIYITPLAFVMQSAYKASKWFSTATSIPQKLIDSTFAPGLQDAAKEGDTIASWIVTSGFGPRSAPCAGCSTEHGGIDLADPRGAKFTKGRALYAIGVPGTKTSISCWKDSHGGGLVATLKAESLPQYTIEYLHLDKCLTKPGASTTESAGKVIARVGSSGVGTNAHLHIQVKNAKGEKIPPPRAIAWWALTGETPQAVVAQKGVK